MKTSTGKPNKREQKRFEAMTEYGCCICRQSHRFRSAEMHHIIDGGRRKGHRYTIPLCDWHHRGVINGNWSTKEMQMLLGSPGPPGGKTWVSEYGSEDQLLATVDEAIGWDATI